MNNNRWLVLALLFLARTAMGFQFQSVGSIAPILVERLGLDYAGIGTLIGLYLLPGLLVALPGGMIGERFGAKRVVVAGLLLMATGGLVMAAGQSFATLAAGRLISGAGAVLMNVLLTKMIADWFAGREIATAMALLVTSWPFGIALGLIGFVPLASALGWPWVMIAAAIVSGLAMLAVIAFYRAPPGSAAAAPARLALTLSGREWLLASFAGFVWGIYNVGYIVLISFLPGHFVAQGYALPQANAVTSWLGWSMMLTVPVGGYLADRFGRPGAVMTFGFAVSAIASVALATGALPMLLAFAIIAMTIGPPAGPIMALPAQALRPQNRATGMGIYFTWYYALMALLPGLAGLARDVTHSSATPLLLAALMLGLSIAGLAAFYLSLNRPKVDV